MRPLKFINSKVHAIADYLTGLFLLFMPWFFNLGFDSLGKWVAVISGVVIILMSLLTNYQGGLIRIVPMRVHLATDLVIGIFYISSSWLFHFDGVSRLAFVFVGILAVFFGLFTVSNPYGRRTRIFHYYN